MVESGVFYFVGKLFKQFVDVRVLFVIGKKIVNNLWGDVGENQVGFRYVVEC